MLLRCYLLNIGYYRVTKFRNRLRCLPGRTLGNAHSRTTARPRPLRQKSADARRRFLDRCLSSGLGGSPRRPCRGQRQPRQSLRRESRDQEGDAGSLSGLSTPLQAPVPVSQLVIHSPAPVVPALVATAGEVGFAPEIRLALEAPLQADGFAPSVPHKKHPFSAPPDRSLNSPFATKIRS